MKILFEADFLLSCLSVIKSDGELGRVLSINRGNAAIAVLKLKIERNVTYLDCEFVCLHCRVNQEEQRLGQ